MFKNIKLIEPYSFEKMKVSREEYIQLMLRNPTFDVITYRLFYAMNNDNMLLGCFIGIVADFKLNIGEIH